MAKKKKQVDEPEEDWEEYEVSFAVRTANLDGNGDAINTYHETLRIRFWYPESHAHGDATEALGNALSKLLEGKI